MRRKNPYSDGNIEEKSENIEENFDKIEETEENQHEIKNNKLFKFTQTLKSKGLKDIGFLVDILNLCTEKISKLTDTRFANFIKEKWQSETDIHEMYLTYRELNIENINKIIGEYYNLNEKIFESDNNFNDIRDEIKRIKVGKLNIDTRELEGELHKLEQEIKSMEEARDYIPKWLSRMGYKKKNIILELGSGNRKFILECVKNNSKIVIIYVVLALLGLLYFILNWNEFYVLGTGLGLAVVTWVYYKILCIVEFRTVRKYTYENNDLKEEIRGDYRKALEIVKSYGKEKKDELPKIVIKEKSEGSKPNLVQPTVQQSKQGEVYNPYKKEWKEIFEQFFKNHNFKLPEYEKFDTTEVHIFSIPTLTVDDFINKAEQIENFIGKKIYKVHKEYDGGIGKIGVEFEAVELARVISYDEVPQTKKKNEIILGKGIKQWVSWDLNTSPHALVVGATGGGKSVTMNFLISEVVKKKYLPIFVDFKDGVEFNIHADKGYRVITERNEYVEFTKQLFGEVKYRSKLLSEYRVKNLDDINRKLKGDNKKILPRLIVVLDEYADVNSIKDEFSDTVNANVGRILAKGRAVGVHLIIGTQRPDAKTIGEGAFRDNIACRLVGKMNSDGAYAMAFGTTNLIKEDKVYVNKLPDDDRFKGMFIVQGTGNIDSKEVIRVPFMDDVEFNDMVLNEWEDNPYADYQLHYSEEDKENMTEDEKFLNNKIYGKENAVEVPYEVVEDGIIKNDEDFNLEDVFK